jgi:hypothetical protein
MVYTIRACQCQHPIRSSSRLPWSGTTLDYDVLYCKDCERSQKERSQKVRYERSEAEREYERSKLRHESGRMKYDEYKGYRSRYDRARIAERVDYDCLDRRASEDRRARGESRPRSSRRQRFEDESSHRRESQYRDQPYYRRTSRSYSPGRYADRSGEGYYNTSRPDDLEYEYDSRREKKRRKSSTRMPSRSRSPSPPTSSTRPRDSSAGYRGRRDSDGYQDYLDTLSSDEISRRQREIEKMLSRYR